MDDTKTKVAAAKKKLIHVANWSIMDEKHRKLPQIQDSVSYLRKICENVRENPEEQKYRKIRVSNKTFGLHVRDAPGGEEYMHEAGWRVKVEDHERYFVFEAQPGSVEWAILEAACAELDKLWALVNDKIERARGDRKAEEQARLAAIRQAIEEDKQERHLQFRYAGGGGSGGGGGGGDGGGGSGSGGGGSCAGMDP